NPLGAVAPLTAAGRPVLASEQMAESQRRAFMNALTPGKAIVIGRHPDIAGRPGERPMLTSQQRQQIIQAMKSMHRGVLAEGEPVILDALIENIFDITKMPKEMDYLNSSKILKDQILQIIGTSPYILGGTE